MGADPSRNTNITRRLRPFCCCLATLEQNFKTILMPHTALRDVYFYIAHLDGVQSSHFDSLRCDRVRWETPIRTKSSPSHDGVYKYAALFISQDYFSSTYDLSPSGSCIIGLLRFIVHMSRTCICFHTQMTWESRIKGRRAVDSNSD